MPEVMQDLNLNICLTYGEKMKEKGIVKWFNDAKGYGFVVTNSGDEIICEKWKIKSGGHLTLKELQEIEFVRGTLPDGRNFADEIEILKDDAVPPPVLKMNKGKVYCEEPFIIVFEDAVPVHICEQIKKKHIADGMNPYSGTQSRQESFAQVTEEVENRGISLGMDPNHYNIIATAIVNNIGIPYSFIEAIDIYNYNTGQYLDLHHDYPYAPQYINYYSHGGDRVGTGILYLNDDFIGGHTIFPKLGVDIHPKAGSILYFKQSYDDEAINWSTIHESSLITQGTKWVASCFFSESERIGFTDRRDFVPEENPPLINEFYVKKFMEIQRGNVQLWRKLKNLEMNPEMKQVIENQMGEDFFKNLDDLIK
jgi:cold shock CspA family protein